MAITSQLLDQFLAVYKLGSLGRACRELGLSQPALSKSMRRLEDQLGVKLFERRPTGLRPSAYADVLARRAEVVGSELARAVQDVSSLRDGHEGESRFGVGPAIAAFLLPQVLARLLARRPGINVRVTEGLYEGLADGVLTGLLDLAITTRPAAPVRPDLAAEPLFRERFVIAADASHPLAGRSDLRPQDLLGCPWVLPPREGLLWHRIVDLFAAHGVAAPTPQVETNSSGCMKGLLRGTPFLTFVPEQLVGVEVARGEIEILDVPDFSIEREVTVLTRRGGVLSPASQLLLRSFREVTQKRPDRGLRPSSPAA